VTSQRIVELAHERRRFGYRRIGDLLRAAGSKINDKRVYRSTSWLTCRCASAAASSA
jgi:hypothetical protein